MRRHVRATMLAGGIAVGALAWLPPHPAMAQQSASDGYLKEFSKRFDVLYDQLNAARYERVVDDIVQTIHYERYPCDLETLRSLLAEMESFARETRSSAEAASAAGEFATLSAESAGITIERAQRLLDRGREAVARCERQNKARSDAQPEPAPPPSPPLTLPDPLEAMLTQTASRARYLELRRMAEPGAKRPVTRPVEDILDEIGDAAAARQARECRAALVRVPPPFAAAVLAAEERADDRPDEWFPAPQFNDTREAARHCAPVAESMRVSTASHRSLNEALAGEIFEKHYATPPSSPPGRPPAAEDTPPSRPGLGSLQDEAYLPLEFWGGIGEIRIPATGIGVTRNGPSGQAPETDAGLTAGKVGTIGLGGAFDFGGVRVRAEYLTGDASTRFDVQPITGGFNGAVFGAMSESRSSGIGAGSATLAGTTKVDLSQLALGTDFTVFRPMPAARTFLTFDYFRDVRHNHLSLTGTVSTTRFSQVRDQRVRDNGFALGVGGETRLPLGPALWTSLEGRVAGYLLNTNLKSVEHNESNFGPPADRDFTIRIDDSASAIGFRGKAGASLGFDLSPAVSLTAGAYAEYRSNVGAAFNPNTGDQVFFDGLTTAIRKDGSWSYLARLSLRMRLP